MRPQLAGTRACLSTDVLKTFNYSLGEQRLNRDLATPISLLKVIKLICLKDR